MRITDKAKRTLIKYFGEEKTQEIIDTAIIKFNRIDQEKFENILEMTNYYTDFWDLIEESKKDTYKDFVYIYDLLQCTKKPNENNTQITYFIGLDGKVHGEVRDWRVNTND